MSDSASRFRRIQALFAGAAGLDRDYRQTFLEEVCGDDLELRRDLESLLTAADAADDLLPLPAHDSESGVKGGGHAGGKPD